MAPSAEDVIEAKQRVVKLEAAIEELPLKCRRALLLNRLEGKTHAEIARTVGVSESMVAKYIVQGLKHCRARLQQGP
jgi:RNA polymerase sigma-70 factor (ECF subfamily)